VHVCMYVRVVWIVRVCVGGMDRVCVCALCMCVCMCGFVYVRCV
jgi:hypothetical protein